jgi:murein DD-endopeptidase MepM/ murein hydrolase activator NlpD
VNDKQSLKREKQRPDRCGAVPAQRVEMVKATREQDAVAGTVRTQRRATDRDRRAAPLTDRRGNALVFEFRVGTDVTPVLARSARSLARQGQLRTGQLRKLARSVRKNSPLTQVDRMFLAGLLDDDNLRVLARTAIMPGATVDFSLASIRAGMPVVRGLDRAAMPAASRRRTAAIPNIPRRVRPVSRMELADPASAGNRAVARALTGRRLLARYEAGEHAELGKTGDDLRSLVAERTLSYTVKTGDTLAGIASKFSISVAQLEQANPEHLRRWRRADGGVGTVVGFEAGQKVRIPPALNAAIDAALKGDELTFIVGGTTMSYGSGIAMGDFFKDPDEMAKASKAELDNLSALVQSERAGKRIGTEQWQKATKGRYLELAQANEAHFAPPDDTLVSSSGVASTNHKAEWERHHDAALAAAQAGNVDQALQINAFADHFLTDAFASGHLINKRDVMERFKKTLTPNAKGEFAGDALRFFDEVAKKSFVGDVKTQFSQHETTEYKGVVFRPNIDSAAVFSKLLQGIHAKEPDLVANAIARAVHTALNQERGGVPVKNALGQQWNLSGDETLNDDTRKIARRAVAQSQLNVLSVHNMVGPLEVDKLHARVWVYTPRPTAAGVAMIKNHVELGTDPRQSSLVDAVVALIRENYAEILRQLVARGILKKA